MLRLGNTDAWAVEARELPPEWPGVPRRSPRSGDRGGSVFMASKMAARCLNASMMRSVSSPEPRRWVRCVAAVEARLPVPSPRDGECSRPRLPRGLPAVEARDASGEDSWDTESAGQRPATAKVQDTREGANTGEQSAMGTCLQGRERTRCAAASASRMLPLV